MKFWGVLAAVAAISACSTSYDRQMATSFMPTQAGWSYKAYADAMTPLDSEAGEKYRISMLEQWLSVNKMCASGYAIDSRRPVVVAEAALGTSYHVYYDGRCT